MPRPSRMSNSFAQSQKGSRGELDQPLLPLDDISRRKITNRQEMDAEAAKWLEAATGSYGQAKELAIDLDVTESYLSDMCSGARSTPLRALLVIKKREPALTAFLSALLEGTNLRVVRKRRATRRKAENAVAVAARRLGALWPVVRQLAAEEAQTDEDDIEAALCADAAADAAE